VAESVAHSPLSFRRKPTSIPGCHSGAGRNPVSAVIPAQAGIQSQPNLDSAFRRRDGDATMNPADGVRNRNPTAVIAAPRKSPEPRPARLTLDAAVE